MKHGPITDLFQEYALYRNFCLTKKGTLLGGIELAGRDSDGLTRDDLMALSLISRSIYLNLPDTVTSVTQYYLHFEGATVRLKHRGHPISGYLSRNRQDFLNSKPLSSAKILHFFEIEPDENLTNLNFLTLLKHVLAVNKSKNSRVILSRCFSTQKTLVAFRQDLAKQARQLEEILLEVQARLESLFACRILEPSGLWAFCRFLANADSGLIHDAVDETVPAEQWDALLAEGDCYPVWIDNQDFLKFQGIDNHYARILSVNRLGENNISPGIWSSQAHSPTRQTGNFVIMTRFLPLSRLRQGLMFGAKKRELKRKSMSIGDIFALLNQGHTGEDRYGHLKPDIREKIIDLEKAEGMGERWGRAQAAVLIFGRTPKQINDTARRLRKSMLQAGMSIVAESVGLPEAFRAIFPSGGGFSIRNMEVNCTQFGAASLLYKSAEGQPRVADLNDEEAQYIFNCPDGTLFHFSPFVGSKAVVICVGPIRSGKSFTRNTIAAHFPKYGGMYRALDIDPGSETLAQFYREDGAIFRIGDGSLGFNNFAVAAGPDDNRFVLHQKQLIMEMLKSNENETLKQLAPHEQHQLDQAIVATLKLPPHLRRLTAMVNHCPQELQQKLKRWCKGGMYAALFDQAHDAVGALDKSVVAFNLAGVKEDPILLPLAMSEITYRVTRMFEDPAHRNVPKYLDIDEAHVLLKLDYMRAYIIRSVRTWGKSLAGIGLWSQDPGEFLDIKEWSVLRSSASTLFFMADPTADTELYQKTFKISLGEIEAIRALKPKQEAYIIQRGLGVSKRIFVQVEPEQHVINTSAPGEAVLRDRLIAQHGIEEGIQKTIAALNLDTAA